MEFTVADKRKCAAREAAMRRNVYPKFIVQGRMTPADAERERLCMEAIAADYAWLETYQGAPLWKETS